MCNNTAIEAGQAGGDVCISICRCCIINSFSFCSVHSFFAILLYYFVKDLPEICQSFFLFVVLVVEHFHVPDRRHYRDCLSMGEMRFAAGCLCVCVCGGLLLGRECNRISLRSCRNCHLHLK